MHSTKWIVLTLAVAAIGNAPTYSAETVPQSVTYRVGDGESPATVEFAPFDDLDNRRQLMAVRFEYDGELAMDLTVKNYDPQPYDANDWFAEAYQNVLLAFASRDGEYMHGGPFFGLGDVSIVGVTGQLSAGTGGGPFGDGTPGDVVVTASVSGPVVSSIAYDGDSLDYFQHSEPLQATIGPLVESLISPPPGYFFIDTPLSNITQSGTLELAYQYRLTGDSNGNDVLDADDIDTLYANLDGLTSESDLNGDGRVDSADVDYLVENLMGTQFGDTNLDGTFDSTDLVLVFQHGGYEDQMVGNSTWSSGDWNGDQEFDSTDFTFAFSKGGYSLASQTVNLVPEPNGGLIHIWIWVTGSCFVYCRRGSGRAEKK